MCKRFILLPLVFSLPLLADYHLYQNNLKNRGFGKEGPQNLHSERETIVERQDLSENTNFEVTPTWPKTDSSSFFGIRNLSLQDAEKMALEYNKNLLIAEQNTEQAKQRKLQAVSSFLPAIHYRAEFRDISKKELFFDVFSATLPFSHQGYSSILQLSQPLFSTDLIFNLKAKNLEFENYSYVQANTKNELLLNVRDRYHAVLFFEKALDIQRENIDYLSYALEQEQGRLQAGNATPFEVNQIKTAVANAISSYYSTLKNLKTARNSLILSLGIDPLLEPEIKLQQDHMPVTEIPELSFKIQELEQRFSYQSSQFPTTLDYKLHIEKLEDARSLTLFTKEEVQEYLNLAFSLRPDLLAKKLEIDIQNQNVNSKLGTYLPKVSGYVRYSYNDVMLGTVPFQDEDYHLSAGLVLSWNLFDSFLREHEVREARFAKAASRISYEKEWQQVEVEVRNGLYQLEEALLTYLSSAQAMLVAEQAREQGRDKLQFGRIPPLDYRDAVNMLAKARNQHNQASFDLLAAYYQLRYSIGIDAK
jgi:outer membrane protein TolC